MDVGRYAPSAKFTTIVVSLLISAGLVFGADYATRKHSASVTTIDPTAQPGNSVDSSDWEASLYAIQAQNASSSFVATNPQTVQQMLASSQSSNITESVGKSILIKLGDAKSQGLGDDIPTQDQIIAEATAQIAASKPPLYKSSDLYIVDDSKAALKEYGNSLVQTINNNPGATERATLVAIDNATNKNDPTALQPLTAIGAAYGNTVIELLALPVPKTLSPFHLSIINSFATMAAAFPDMQATLADPLRGMVGFQTYEAQISKISRVFTNIAQDFSKNGILFTRDEPGAVFSSQ